MRFLAGRSLSTGARKDAKLLRFRGFVRQSEAFSDESALKKFADGSRAARHAPGEAPIVERHQFVLAEHDLQSFNATEACHDSLQAIGKIYSYSFSDIYSRDVFTG
jgi:hypothetical protein